MEMHREELLIDPSRLVGPRPALITSVTVHLPEVEVKPEKPEKPVKHADADASLPQYAKEQMEFVKTMKDSKQLIRQYVLENSLIFRIRLGIALLFVTFYLYCCICC